MFQPGVEHSIPLIDQDAHRASVLLISDPLGRFRLIHFGTCQVVAPSHPR